MKIDDKTYVTFQELEIGHFFQWSSNIYIKTGSNIAGYILNSTGQPGGGKAVTFDVSYTVSIIGVDFFNQKTGELVGRID